MPWKELEAELAEEFGVAELDRFNRDGFIIQGPPDPEVKRNYTRWYKKQVFYPKHRERLKMIAAQYYYFHKLMQDDVWRSRLESWYRRNKLRATPGTKQYKKWMAYCKQWKKKKYATDESYRRKVLEANKRRYKKRVEAAGKTYRPAVKLSPEERKENIRRYMREYRKRMMADPEKRAKALAYYREYNKQPHRKLRTRGKKTSDDTGG